jgi:hypothetical protein
MGKIKEISVGLGQIGIFLGSNRIWSGSNPRNQIAGFQLLTRTGTGMNP